MNREIKFRAWQKDKKMMCEVSSIYFKGEQASLKEKENVTNTRDFKDIELMQFTGLYDKNKVPIYEGDIIKYKDSTGQHTEKVIFDKGCFFAGLHGGSSTRVAPKLINTRLSEVIGNIYENSELLGE